MNKEEKAAEKYIIRRFNSKHYISPFGGVWFPDDEHATQFAEALRNELKLAVRYGIAWRDKHPKVNETDLFLKIATDGGRFGMSTPAVRFEKKEAQK